MSRLCPFVALGDDGTAPLAVGIGSLPRGAIGTGVGIVRTSRTRATVYATRADSAPVGSPRGVVPGSARHSAIGPVGAARVTVGSVIRVVESAHAVSDRVRPIDGIGIGSIVKVRRIVVAGSVRDSRSHGHSNDEHAEIARGAAGFDLPARCRGLCYVGYVVDRRTRWNGVNLLRNGCRSLPGALGGGRHEPHALETHVIEVTNLDDLILRVRGIRQGS